MMRSMVHLERPPLTPFLDAGMDLPGSQKLDIASARNHLVEMFLTAHEKHDWLPEPLNWLLMVDGDAVLHPQTLRRLASWNKAVVGALCVTRYKPYQPVVYRGLATDRGGDMRSHYIQWQEVRQWVMDHPALVTLAGYSLLEPAPEDSLHPVDWTGSHTFLVHRTVFEAVPAPWFEVASKIRYGSGSDRLFFEKVNAHGFQTYVDYSVVAGHDARSTLGMADFMAWQSISIAESGNGDRHWVGDDIVERAPDDG